MADSPPERIRVFISYSHKNDKKHLERLQIHLAPSVREKLFEVWDDTHIQPGDQWKTAIEQAVAAASVAIFLVSADFFASKFIATSELPPLLEAARKKGTRILTVIVGPCDFSATELGQLQAVNSPSKPLNSLKGYQRDDIWVKVVNHIKETLASATSRPPEEHKAPPSKADMLALPPKADQKADPVLFETAAIIYKDHSNWVNAVAWSPDGTQIASASYDQTVQVWDATTGKLLVTYTGHPKQVNSIAWSPDGTRIVSGSGGFLSGVRTVQIWNAATGQHLFAYTGHSNSVRAVAWSPDGKHIASGSDDKTVQVWDANSGQHLFTYKGHTGAVYTVAWSHSGTQIASGSLDKTVQVWDATSGELLLTYNGHSVPVYTVGWSHDDKRIASGGNEKAIQIWKAATGDHLLNYENHSIWLRAVAWSHDDTQIASGGWDNTVQVWDATTGESLFTHNGHSNWVYAVAWSPDGKRIASASYDKTVQVWSAG